MEARIRNLIVAAVALSLGACSHDEPAPPGPGPAPETAAGRIAGITRALVGHEPQALDTVMIGWTDVDAAGKAGAGWLATLAYPDKFRLERRATAERPGQLWKISGAAVFCGPAAAGTKTAGEHDRGFATQRFMLLAALCAWDLRTITDARLNGDALTTVADWCRIVQPGPTIVRHFDDSPLPARIDLGGERWACGAAGKTRLRDVLATGERSGMRFDRFEPGIAVKPAYFLPRVASTDPNVVMHGTERHNFEKPILEKLPEVYELVIEDPGSWKDRLETLETRGGELYELGQASAGLPAYSGDGRMHVFFVPRATGGKPRAPDAALWRKRPAQYALVLYVNATLAEARKLLAPRLEEHARHLGLKPHGGLMLIPYVIPGEKTPGPNQAIRIRGEWAVR